MKNFSHLVTFANIVGIQGKDGRIGIDNKVEGRLVRDLLRECQPIVFTPQGKEWDGGEVSGTDIYKDNVGSNTEHDAPFSVFSIEMLENIEESGKPRAGCIKQIVSDNKGKPVREFLVYCILCYEISPRNFSYLILQQSGPPSFNPNDHDSYPLDLLAVSFVGDLVDEFLNRLRTQKLGSHSARAVIKIGKGKTKEDRRIRRVVYVSPQRKTTDVEKQVYGTIDWSHRWLVRGHWRACEGRLGKDRAGDYKVSNFTWVTEHEKGPEDKPLINKVRVVDPSQNINILPS